MSELDTISGEDISDIEMGNIHRPLRRQGTAHLALSTRSTFSTPLGRCNEANKQKIEEDDEVQLGKFRLEDLNIDVTQIIRSLRSDLHFPVKEGYAMEDLPKFDDLTRYGITEDKERDLWEFEVHRLKDAASSVEPPLLEGDPVWFGQADTSGYNCLHRLAMQVSYAVDICIHDNELVMLEHEPRLANDTSYDIAHRRICRIFDQDQGSIRYKRRIKIDSHNDEALHALLNYITAVLARLLMRSMNGKLWVDNCITVLAKFAAKCKIVGVDLPTAFEKTLQAHKDCQYRIAHESDVRGAQNVVEAIVSKSDDDRLAKQQKALQEDIDTSGARYFLEMDTFRHFISMLIESANVDLKWNEESEQKADIFETSTVIYHTGFDGKRTQLCQERDGNIGAASDQRAIDFAGVAFQIGLEIWEYLRQFDDREAPSYTTVTWSRKFFSESESTSRDTIKSHDTQVQLGNMKEIIGAMVPYMMYCGSFASALSTFANVVMTISDPSTPVRYYRQEPYLTTARINTSEYKRLRPPKSTGLARNVFETDMAKKARCGKPNNQLRKKKSEVGQHWTIDEKAVIIQHGWYSYITLGVCAFMIAGGVAVIAIGEKARGVDPSNLTALAWAAAGFAMVFFKSLRVQDWPWRDFLRGRVVCRSVSEVVSVTRMHPQDLIAILLRMESRNVLHTRGPFNTLFSRKADDGFSIDIPLLTNTVIDGGYIFIRVDSNAGPALVALRTSNAGIYHSISQKDGLEDGEGFVCRDLIDATGLEVRGHDKPLPFYAISTNDLRWNRVRGIFTEEAWFD
ncbi:hypothetical protein FCOIX_11276 [Fusarium coicis]|nr:hypothetical protein FCOIX_11276 [Fusarium coicis]